MYIYIYTYALLNKNINDDHHLGKMKYVLTTAHVLLDGESGCHHEQNSCWTIFPGCNPMRTVTGNGLEIPCLCQAYLVLVGSDWLSWQSWQLDLSWVLQTYGTYHSLLHNTQGK